MRIIIIENEPDPPKNTGFTFRRLASAMGIALGGSGLALVAFTGRPSRLGLGLLGSGAALTLIAIPELLTANIIAGSIVGLTCVSLGPFYVFDQRELEVQRIFQEARHLLPFPPDIRFDDFGPGGHSVSRPRYEIIHGSIESLVYGRRESIKVEIQGFIQRPDGELEPIIGYAYASRSFPFERFVIDRLEMA